MLRRGWGGVWWSGVITSWYANFLFSCTQNLVKITVVYPHFAEEEKKHFCKHWTHTTSRNPCNVGYRLVSWDSIVKEFPTITEYLVNGWVGLYCEKFFLRSIFSAGALSTFIHLYLGKAGPFTLEATSMLKPWKCKVSQIIRFLIKPLSKNSTQTIFQVGTPWVTQILNNVIASIVPYCAQKLVGIFWGCKTKTYWK